MESFFNIKDFIRNDKVNITEQGLKNIKDLCDIVIYKHFSYTSKQDREDLISVGTLKIVELLNKGVFDETKSSLKNYLYTGVRNEMKNYLYRNTKDIAVEDDILISVNEVGEDSLHTEVGIISNEIIHEICMRLKVTQEDEEKIKDSLLYMGFHTESKNRIYYREVDKEVSLIIWAHLDKARR